MESGQMRSVWPGQEFMEDGLLVRREMPTYFAEIILDVQIPNRKPSSLYSLPGDDSGLNS